MPDSVNNTYQAPNLSLIQSIAGEIKLETPLGGGKTHNLIVLYHLAKSCKSAGNLSQFLYEIQMINLLTKNVVPMMSSSLFPLI
ncbi:MAG: hypothetical protein ACP5VS_19815, partial [Desulfomonilaceae bacterium]